VRPAAFALSLALVLAATVSTAAAPTHDLDSTSTNPRFIPRSVSFISPSVGWALGPIGRAEVGPALLAMTTDGGRSWRAVNAPGLPDAPDGYPKGPTLPVGGAWPQLVVRGRGVYVLASEHLWASDDAGRSWQRLTTPCTWPGANGATLAAWSASGLALACGSQPGWGEVSLTDATHGVAVPWTLSGSVLAFTSDGGRRWTEVGFTSSAGAPLPASPPSP
jgi:photosystem II stability/assembly factor-like uncharacterized protein